MTDRLAIWLGVLLALAILGDIFVNQGAAMLFLLRKFAVFVVYLQFWN